jgi:NADP-dependent 3-hydroxy acid dehydrogenase YdfG
MMTTLDGKMALVTGASAGIGRATAVALVQAGGRVIATGRRTAELAALKKQCGARAAAVEAIAGDLNDASFARDLADAAHSVDILVNNAGIVKCAPILEMIDADCEAMFRINVLAAFRIAQMVARPMAARGRGHIIMMSSIAARDVYQFFAIYAATKHAFSAIARGLRIELQGQGIKVTEIAPGMVDTAIRDSSDHPHVLEALKARKYRALTPEDVAEAVVFAASAAPNCCPDLIELRPQGAA